MNERKDKAAWPKLSNYRIVREIARGGMGIVYEAEQLSLGRRVALKTLATDRNLGPNAEERFQMEARSASRLHHSNIVPVFEVGHEAGISFYAMQYIGGMGLDQVTRRVGELLDSTRKGSHEARSTKNSDNDSLAELLADSLVSDQPEPVPVPTGTQIDTDRDEKGVSTFGDETISTGQNAESETGTGFVLSPAETHMATPRRAGPTPILDGTVFRKYCRKVARVGMQVGSALEHAHKRGVIHRDIKPSNLLLDMNGTVWITDFGLAKVDESDLTQTGNVVGTLRFISPERFEGQCDARSDIYALGITLYEMLALRPAFVGVERASLLEKIRTSRPPRLRSVDPRIPKDLETIVEKAMEPDPVRRYASAGELADDLDRFLENRPIQARKITPVGRVVRWAQRNRMVAALLFSVALGLVALTTVSALAANSFRNLAMTEKTRADTEMKLRESEQQSRKMAENVRDFIVSSYGSPNRDTDGKSITVYEVLKREVANIPKTYDEDELTQAVLLHAIGDSFESLSEYPDSIAALTMALEIYERLLGQADRRTIEAMTSLVNVYVSDQQGQAAVDMAQRVYELTMLHYADSEEFLLSAENNLASAWFTNGEDVKAAPLFESVLGRMRELHGNDDENTLDAMYNLIQAYHWLSRKEDEKQLVNEFLQISVNKFGPNSLEVAKAKEAAAEMMGDDESEAEMVLRQEVYDIRMALLGETHHKTLDAISALATLNLSIGDKEEGLRLKQVHYDRCLEKFGEIHRTTVASATGMARALADSGDELAAIEWLERALANGRQVDPENDPNLLNTKQGLAYYCYKNGDKQRARELYTDIFENGFEATGFQTSRVKLACQSAIVIQHELRQLEETEASARRFHELVYEQAEPAGWETVGANAALAAVLYDLGEYEDSLQFANAAIDVPLGGEGFPRGVVRSRMIKGLILVRRDDAESGAGEQMLEEAFDEFRAELPKMSVLSHWMATRACERAIDAFESVGNPDKVAEWTARLNETSAEIDALKNASN